MTKEEAQKELDVYVGIPMCQDCGWRLNTDITDNCSCSGPHTPEKQVMHEKAFNRARELQKMIYGQTN